MQHRCTIALLLGAAISLLAGCQSGVIPAAQLPTELAASAAHSAQELNLSQYARAALDTRRIYRGDVVSVTISTGLEPHGPPTHHLRVDEEGAVKHPLIGSVRVAGLTLIEAEQLLEREGIERGYFVRPHVGVAIKDRRTHQVQVMGAVKTPGFYKLPVAASDVVNAITMAGGLTEEAGSVVEIREAGQSSSAVRLTSHESDVPPVGSAAGDPLRRRLDLAALDLAHRPQDADRDLLLGDGATVMVMKQPARSVQVLGLVNRPDQYELPVGQSMRLLDAVALAGGLKLQIADKVRIMRRVPGQSQPAVIEASIRRAKLGGPDNLELAAGDVVSVEEPATTFIVGTVQNFVRFGFSAAIPGI